MIIFVGPQPDSPHAVHAGGQLAATRAFDRFAKDRGVQVSWVDTAQSNFPVPPLHERMGRALKRVVRFARLIRRPDASGAILFAGAGVSLVERSLLALIARLCAVPALLMIRSGHFQRSYEGGGMLALLYRVLLRMPSRIGVQGESWLPFMERAGVARARLLVIPNWLSKPARNPSIRRLGRDETLRLIFVGWMTEAKGVPELLAAVSSLVMRGTNVSLTMVGGGTLLTRARSLAERPDLRDRLCVTGWVDPDEVETHLSTAHVLVLPSHAEGLPNIMLEAMSVGLPVIATPVGAIPDTLRDGENGLLIGVGDPDGLVEAVERYRNQPVMVSVHSKEAIASITRLHDRETNCGLLLDGLSLTSAV